MGVDFDPDKRDKTLAERGLDFVRAGEVFDDPHLDCPDTRTVWVDPDDAPELTDAFFENATPHVGDRVVTHAEYGAAVRRGRPKADVTKVAVKLRLAPDLLAVLKATGPGWQTRANRILRERFAL